jgi:hypothetical protein
VTERAYESSRSESAAKRRNQSPQRSRIAPVSGRAGEESSEVLKDLLAGIEPKVASMALVRADVLGKLPAAQQVVLRCALQAASESYKKGECLEVELANVKKHLERAGKDLFAESQAFHQQAARAEEQILDLREDLAASIAANQARESHRCRVRKISFLLVLGAATAVLLGYAFLAQRSAPMEAADNSNVPQAADSSSPKVVVVRSEIAVAGASGDVSAVGQALVGQALAGQALVGQAFDRMEEAMARVPLLQVDSVLREANQWLALSGIAPCAIELPEGQTALLVGGKVKTARPLTTALGRCAEAVEHVSAQP